MIQVWGDLGRVRVTTVARSAQQPSGVGRRIAGNRRRSGRSGRATSLGAVMASTTPDQQEQQIAAQPTSWRVAVGAGLAVALFIGLFVAAFLWPITTASPQHIPLAVAGPQPAVAAVEQQLTARSPELFEVATVPDRQAAVAAIH